MTAIFTHNLGFPRIGPVRELKTATEKYWQGKISQEELTKTGAELRKKNWLLQKEKGINLIPSNDFSFYDQTLDTVALFGAVPPRFDHTANTPVDLDTYFTMARGLQEKDEQKDNKYALEMLKWLDTNYHYMVPEFLPTTEFSLSSTKVFDEFSEALALGIVTKPVLIGPLTFLLLGKTKQQFDKVATLLPKLVPLYVTVLQKLSALGAKYIQIDEPILVKDLSTAEIEAFKTAYATISKALDNTDTKLILATYFDNLSNASLSLALSLPIHVLHVDLTRGSTDVVALVKEVEKTEKIISLGVINGRNIWKSRYAHAVAQIRAALFVLPNSRVWIAPSCSLIHSPISLQGEKKLNAQLLSVLAFATEKLDEVVALSKIALEKEQSAALTENNNTWDTFLALPALTHTSLRARISALTQKDYSRDNAFKTRRVAQQKSLNLPLFPTTTIGSLPQTTEVRNARLKLRKGELTHEAYRKFIEEKIKEGIKFQEDIDLDVLVTGEFERNDMVEYFGGALDGFAFTENGWVQSFGSRYVKPPIIWADVTRPKPITVEENVFSSSLTSRPVKGMLTGPITLLQWSFVREDIPRSLTATQLGLAMRDEVSDLVGAGVKIVQVDEPAFREGLPIKRERWEDYLDWASKAFKLATSGVADEIQIHTHMCYAEFSDIISAILALDADVISIESSRSQMKLLPIFTEFKYQNEIGPGVFDIHSPTIPDTETMVSLLHAALEVLPVDLVWVNPDCGLKTRQWSEVKVQLANMVQAAKKLRQEKGKTN